MAGSPAPTRPGSDGRVVADDIGPASRETHSGVVLLLGERAYKFKKPIDLGFLDLRSVPARAECCRREVELNRRLAPDVYLGLGRLSDPTGGPDEPTVVMRRMPERTRLTTLVRDGAELTAVMDRIARMMATFHATARRAPEIDAAARPPAILERWESTFADVRRDSTTVLAAADVDRADHLVHGFLTGRDRLFQDRIRHGRIVDGHGDLLCDDIFCLPDGPRVLDCLEFDDRLRFVDGLDDIAFLAMDLEHLGALSLARLLVDRYTDYAADPAPGSLWHHYLAYRAYVRVKVACLRHRQGDPDAAAQARSLAALAGEHLRAGRVHLILIGGLPGSGKSTVAASTADLLSAVLISSDVTRQAAAAGEGVLTAAAPAAYRRGRYDRPHLARTYGELLRRAELCLGAGDTVVVDASFTQAGYRAAAAEVAARTHADLVPMSCQAPTAVRNDRLRRRPPGPSEATPEIAERMARDEDPWPDAIVVDTAGSIDDTMRRVRQIVGPPVGTFDHSPGPPARAGSRSQGR